MGWAFVDLLYIVDERTSLNLNSSVVFRTHRAEGHIYRIIAKEKRWGGVTMVGAIGRKDRLEKGHMNYETVQDQLRMRAFTIVYNRDKNGKVGSLASVGRCSSVLLYFSERRRIPLSEGGGSISYLCLRVRCSF
jgi:hypothetical protein